MEIEREKLLSALEALLFINENSVEASELARIFEADKKSIEGLLDELAADYLKRGSGICVVKVAGGYQMCSSPENETWVKKMLQERNKQKLSIASLETLAIIAYKQPITRIEIEAIRGVNVDGVMKKLTDADLIKISGKKDVVGRPFLYSTTTRFLEYFGLNSLKDLPKLEDFVALAEQNKKVEENSEESSEAQNIQTSESNETAQNTEENTQASEDNEKPDAGSSDDSGISVDKEENNTSNNSEQKEEVRQ